MLFPHSHFTENGDITVSHLPNAHSLTDKYIPPPPLPSRNYHYITSFPLSRTYKGAHTSAILAFLSYRNTTRRYLISAGMDNYIKIWSLKYVVPFTFSFGCLNFDPRVAPRLASYIKSTHLDITQDQ